MALDGAATWVSSGLPALLGQAGAGPAVTVTVTVTVCVCTCGVMVIVWV